MLDGLPIDSFTDAMSLDPWAFERVEIQKGPASILYANYMTMDFAGNESPLAGTTNFILKESIDHTLSRVQLGLGSYQTTALRLYHQQRIGDLSFFVGGFVERSFYTQYGQTDSWLQTTQHPDYTKTKLYGKASYRFADDHTLSLFVNQTDHDGDQGRPNRDYNHHYQTLNLKYNLPLSSAWRFQLHGGIRNNDRTFTNDNFSTSSPDLSYSNTDHYRQKIIPVDATFHYLHNDHDILTLGGDTQWVTFRSDRFDGASYSSQNSVNALSKSLFAQEKVIVGDWVLRGGIRSTQVEHTYRLLSGSIPTDNHATWSKTLWNVGARWNITPHVAWYANIGTSFMTPSAKQVGGTIANPLTDSGQIANPSLQSELGTGHDMGIEWRPSTEWKIGSRLFYNKINDAIVDSVMKSSPSQTQSFNAGHATSLGAEFDVDYHMSETLDAFANITLTKTRVHDDKVSDNDHSQIPFVPDTLTNLGITAMLPWDITASAYIQHIGQYYDATSKTSRQSFGNLTLVNAKIQKNMVRTSRYSMTALFDLINLTNEKYTMPWGFRDPGLGMMASVSLSF